jgi:hypothetical protein
MEKKSSAIAHFSATASMFVAFVWFQADMDKRIELNGNNIRHIKQTRIEDVKRVDASLNAIHKKLDLLLLTNRRNGHVAN